jgi:hypothetical protein
MSTSGLFTPCSLGAHPGFAPRSQLTSAWQSETLRPEQVWVGVMMRIGMAVIWLALAGVSSLSATSADAQTVAPGVRTEQPLSTEAPAQNRKRRSPARLNVYPNFGTGPEGVYPRYYPGRNAVRECNATYVQEYRPSGTVIVPHMSCYWRPVPVGNY